MYMLQGGAPCVSDAYTDYFARFITEQQLPNLFLFDPENDYGGFDKTKVARHMSPAIVVADILQEIEQVVCVVAPPGSADQLRQAACFAKLACWLLTRMMSLPS